MISEILLSSLLASCLWLKLTFHLREFQEDRKN